MRIIKYNPTESKQELSVSKKKFTFYILSSLIIILIIIPGAFSQQDENFGWNPQETEFEDELGDIVSVNTTHAWAISTNGRIISTQDGGFTWEVEYSSAGSVFNELSYSNGTLYVVGDLGTIIRKTVNTDWEVLPQITPTNINSVSHFTTSFASIQDTIVHIAGDNGEVWRSADGGENWVFLDTLTDKVIEDINFYNSTHGFVVGEDSLLLGTLNAGQEWVQRDIPENVTGSFRAIEIINYVRIYIVGDGGSLISSRGRAVGWTFFLKDTPTTSDLYDISASSTLKFWVVGENGTIINTINGAGEFTRQKLAPEYNSTNIYGVDVHDGENGWVVGQDGIILQTSTGGIALRDIPTVADYSNFDVYWDFVEPKFREGFNNLLDILWWSIALGFFLGLTLAIIRTTRGPSVRPKDFLWNLELWYKRNRGIIPRTTKSNPLREFWQLILIFWRYIFGLLIWVIKAFATLFVDFMRNTPLLVQLFLIHFGFPEVSPVSVNFLWWSWDINLIFEIPGRERVFVSVILGLGLNSAAYQSEIIRSGIQAIPSGQVEAGRSVGLSYLQTLRTIIIPQAIRLTIPPLGNEAANLVLNTSLASTIGYFEITRASKLIIATTFLNFQTYLILLMYYFVITYTFTNILRFLEYKSKIPGLGMN
ncbi:MAG: YCF48-related protein [Candidatus Kariarchaeaceae archaeon]|jgi:polar amino acid transport system permease protein